MQSIPDITLNGGSDQHREHHEEEEEGDGLGKGKGKAPATPPPFGSETSCEDQLDSSIADSLEVDSSHKSSPDMVSLEVDPSLALPVLEVDTDADDTVSVYAMSAYPRVLPEYRAERPFDGAPEVEVDGGDVTIEIDPDYDDATIDSARTLYAGDYDFVIENGRRYCGDYYLPCDEDEQTRQWLVHSVYRDLFHNELTTAPLENPTHVLDIGTGIGEWATDLAEKYPDCQVWGTDIAPVQPVQVPMNVEWNLEDAETDWARPADTFDLVHVRNMSGAFTDWSFIYQQAFHCIKPGGWIEVLDFDDHRAYRNFISMYPPGSPMHILFNSLFQASLICGRPMGVEHMDEKHFINAGFVDVHTSTHDLPIGQRQNPSFGNKWLLAVCLSIQAVFLRPLTKFMGMDGEYVSGLCKAVEDETRAMADDPVKSRGFLVKIRVVTARKPLVPGQWTAQALTENGHMVPDMAAEMSGDESTIGSLSHARRSEDTA